MKTAKLLGIVWVTLSSFPLLAQQIASTTNAGAQASPQGAQVAGSSVDQMNTSAKGAGAVSSSANGSAAVGEEMRPVNGELVGKLDSKSAKVGDQVVMKTQAAVKTADGTAIPKGTRLVGHVTSVQAHGSGSADSHIAIQFDHAELKGGQSLAIHSEIRSLAPPASATAASSMQGDDDFGGGMMGGARMGGGSMGGGGRAMGAGGLAGSTGGSLREVSDTTRRAGSGLGSTANESVRASGQVADNAAANARGNRANLTGGTASAISAHATGVRGVMLAGNASGGVSGTLSATKQNVHLDSGTQIVLGVSATR